MSSETIGAVLHALLRTALEVVAPEGCAVCGLPGDSLCRECSGRLAPVAPPLCLECGHPWSVEVRGCRACLVGAPRSRAAILYDGRARKLVSALKDHGRTRVARSIAELVAAAVSRPDVDALVPVPLARRRLVARGFNQSALIATHLGAEWGLPMVGALRRVHDGTPQRGRSGRARRSGLGAAFESAGDVPASACLVDDVQTTGATLAACARALRSAGATTVVAVTAARAPIGDGRHA